MTKKVFTTTRNAAASLETVATVISHPQRILDWVPEVATVTAAPNSTTFHVTRQGDALNTEEDVTVTSTDGVVEYESRGGRLAYNLRFDLEDTGEGTLISETLSVPDDTDTHLPLRLLAPIAHRAFATNLSHLVALIESEVAA